MIDKVIILSLIRDDLTYWRLLSGLSSIGFESDNYYLYLSETIFNLMGFQENDQKEKIFDRYMEFTDTVPKMGLEDFFENLDSLAEEIYVELQNALVQRT